MHEKEKLLDILKTVVTNKALFQSKSNEFFEVKIKPIWEANGNKKLSLWYEGGDSEVTIGGRKSPRARFLPEDTYRYDSMAYSMIDGGNLLQQSFLWFIGSELRSLTKYFLVRDLRGWAFFNGELVNKERGSMDFGAGEWKYGESWCEFIKFTPTSMVLHDLEDNAQALADQLMVTSVNDFLGEGFMPYIVSKLDKGVGVPKQLRNEMDFAMWKMMVDKVDIRSKNIMRIVYCTGTTHVEGLKCKGAGKYVVRMWEYLLSNERLRGYVYIKDLFSKIELNRVAVKGGCSGMMTEYRFDLMMKRRFLWRGDTDELTMLLGYADLSTIGEGKLMEMLSWLNKDGQRGWHKIDEVVGGYELSINHVIELVKEALVQLKAG